MEKKITFKITKTLSNADTILDIAAFDYLKNADVPDTGATSGYSDPVYLYLQGLY